MFGHNDDQNDNQQDDSNDTLGAMPPVVPDPSVTAGLNDSPSISPANDSSSTSTDSNDAPSAPSVPPGPTGPSLVEPTTPDEPTTQEEPASEEDASSKGSSETTSETPNESSSETPTPANGELMNLKQQALQQLSPLVGHLDQTPEEKFRTTMMMIQASDDSTLIKTAFEAAGAIGDDKARAQALLDVINEINYFTQHKTDAES